MKRTKFVVYGRLVDIAGRSRQGITREFAAEDVAMAHLMGTILTAPVDLTISAVLVRVDTYALQPDLAHEVSYGKHQDEVTVLVRLGGGKAWTE